jgi:mono/diheme cytochrome c family protein
MRFGTFRTWSWLGAGLLAALLAMQLVPYGQAQTNPPTVAEPHWDSPATRALAKQACFDCHSNETYWPPYARIAPASWLIQRDVEEGRAVLNFSEWNRPQEEAKEAGEVLQEGEMPPAAYKLMHRHARLGPADRELLAQGLAKSLGTAHGSEDDDKRRGR